MPKLTYKRWDTTLILRHPPPSQGYRKGIASVAKLGANHEQTAVTLNLRHPCDPRATPLRYPGYRIIRSLLP